MPYRSQPEVVSRLLALLAHLQVRVRLQLPAVLVLLGLKGRHFQVSERLT